MDILLAYKLAIQIGIAVILFLAETIVPFRTPVEKRWCHIARNLSLTVINAVLLAVLYAAILGSVAFYATTNKIGLLHFSSLPPALEWIILFLLFDITLYLWHRSNHTFSFLWCFHRVHHTDRDLDFSSGIRFHFGELFLSILVKAAFILLTGASFSHILIFDLFVTIFALFNHSNIHFTGSLEKMIRSVIVTPDMHRVHHSQIQKETDSNYCTILSVWDRLFGSFRIQEKQSKIAIGLAQYTTAEKTKFLRLLIIPFKK